MKKFFLLPIIFAFAFFFVKFPTYAAAPSGNYLVLNGGEVDVANPDSLSPDSFYFSANINPSKVSGKQVILSIGDRSNGKLYYEVWLNGSALAIDYNFGGSHVALSSGNLVAGSWQDIAVEISSTQTKLFINGQTVFAPFINNSNFAPIGPYIVLGDNFFTEAIINSHPFKGLIDEVKIVRNGNTLILWHLDEARGILVATDSSGNNLNGSLVGGDSLIHFFGVLPTPTPWQFGGLPPVNWTRPAFPTLSFPFRPNPSPTNSQPPSENPNPPISSPRAFPRHTRSFTR